MSDKTASQDVWQRLFDLAPADPLSVNDLRAMYAAIDEIERLRDEVDTLIERLRRPSWDDLMVIVDNIYPADVFDGSSGNEGPRTLTLMREIERLLSLITEWADAEAKYREREYMEDWPAFESAATALRKAVGR
jgi:hypothetical protein